MPIALTVKKILEMDRRFESIEVTIEEHDTKIDNLEKNEIKTQTVRRDFRDLKKDYTGFKDTVVKEFSNIHIKLALREPDGKRWSKIVDYIIMFVLAALMALIFKATST